MRIAPLLRNFLAVLLIAASPLLYAQGSATSYTVAEVQQAFNAIENAGDYQQFSQAVATHEALLGHPQVLQLVDRLLESAELSDEQRNFMHLERALVHDVGQYGAGTAAQLSGIRFIAGATLSAQTVEELAAAMNGFAPLAHAMSPEMVQAALQQPANRWPAALLPLLQQLGRDWPVYGAQGAAARLAESVAANGSPAEQSEASSQSGYVEDRIGESFLETGQPIPRWAYLHSAAVVRCDAFSNFAP